MDTKGQITHNETHRVMCHAELGYTGAYHACTHALGLETRGVAHTCGCEAFREKIPHCGLSKRGKHARNGSFSSSDDDRQSDPPTLSFRLDQERGKQYRIIYPEKPPPKSKRVVADSKQSKKKVMRSSLRKGKGYRVRQVSLDTLKDEILTDTRKQVKFNEPVKDYERDSGSPTGGYHSEEVSPDSSDRQRKTLNDDHLQRVLQRLAASGKLPHASVKDMVTVQGLENDEDEQTDSKSGTSNDPPSPVRGVNGNASLSEYKSEDDYDAEVLQIHPIDDQPNMQPGGKGYDMPNVQAGGKGYDITVIGTSNSNIDPLSDDKRDDLHYTARTSEPVSPENSSKKSSSSALNARVLHVQHSTSSLGTMGAIFGSTAHLDDPCLSPMIVGKEGEEVPLRISLTEPLEIEKKSTSRQPNRRNALVGNQSVTSGSIVPRDMKIPILKVEESDMDIESDVSHKTDRREANSKLDASPPMGLLTPSRSNLGKFLQSCNFEDGDLNQNTQSPPSQKSTPVHQTPTSPGLPVFPGLGLGNSASSGTPGGRTSGVDPRRCSSGTVDSLFVPSKRLE
eukprot:1378498-Amorphochlora_amoeboformis.AAC.1